MGAKLCAPLWPFRSIVDVQVYKNYFATSLQGATKNCQVRSGSAKKTEGSTSVPPFVRTESLLSRAVFKNVLGFFRE